METHRSSPTPWTAGRPQARLLVRLLPALLIVLALALMPTTALAANPPPYETYFVPLPDDWLMQHMEDLDQNDPSTH